LFLIIRLKRKPCFLAKDTLLLNSYHPEGWEKMKNLEKKGMLSRTMEIEELQAGPPLFVTNLIVSTLSAINVAFAEIAADVKTPFYREFAA
jgi:hypothetical protein